uniref:VWFA domain-containing protein n=1 Tax=Amphora coffeiformis TaxID=265554 RepID=A0A7S3P4B9_9STRA
MNPHSSNTNDDDEDTITTAASSFVHVNTASTTATGSGGPPLILSMQPRHESVGLDAVDSTNQNKYVVDQICATIRALETQEGQERAAVDILVALDVSGSMDGDKLALCKNTLELLVRVLQAQDRFGLITYASEARLDLPAQRLTADHKAKCLQSIRKLTTRGCTNISAALGLAAQEMHAVESPNPVRSIFLLTDGLANEGICQPAALVQLAQNCLVGDAQLQTNNGDDDVQIELNRRSFMGFGLGSNGRTARRRTPSPAPPATQIQFTARSQIPITLHTFGYGVDHNETLLQEMSNATEGGSYYFVEDDKSVSTAFGDAIGGIVSVVAQNTVLHLHVPPAAAALGVKICKVHHDQVIARENGSYTVTVGDFYGEEIRDVVLDVQLATPAEATMDNPIPHLTAKLCYTDTLQRRPVESAAVTASISRPTGTAFSRENDHVAAQWLRVFSVEQMEQAEALASASNFEAARTSLGLVSAAYHQQSPSVQAHAESTSVYQSSLGMVSEMSTNAVEYRSMGVKRSKQLLVAHKRQRAAPMAPRHYTVPTSGGLTSAPTGTNAPYDTKSKKAMRTMFS